MAALTESSFWILTALAEGPRHGYAILRDVEEASAGAVTLRATTLYASLERLERDGLVRTTGEEIVDGRARRYVELTPDGRASLDAEAERLAVRAQVARTRLATRPATGMAFS